LCAAFIGERSYGRGIRMVASRKMRLRKTIQRVRVSQATA